MESWMFSRGTVVIGYVFILVHATYGYTAKCGDNKKCNVEGHNIYLGENSKDSFYFTDCPGSCENTDVTFEGLHEEDLSFKTEKKQIIVTKNEEWDYDEPNQIYVQVKLKSNDLIEEYFVRSQDENDIVPSFFMPVYFWKVKENEKGARLEVKASDGPSQCTKFLKFSIENQESLKASISISKGEGGVAVLTLNEPLDFESEPSIQFKVNVEDGKLYNVVNLATTEVFILVDDVADTPPTWVEKSISARMSEDKNIGTEVAFVRAVDGDIMIKEAIIYSIEGGEGSEFFEMSPEKDGSIILKSNVDRETGSEMSIKIKATEQDSKMYVETEIKIYIDDVNDEQPKFKSECSFEIKENHIVGIIDGLPIEVEDKDTEMFARYTLEILEDEYKQTFQIVPEEGIQKQRVNIKVLDSEKLDFETLNPNPITFHILATDKDNKKFNDTLECKIKVEDVNDCPPVFPNETYKVSIEEHAEYGTLVLTVNAKDDDLPPFNEISYYFPAQEERLSIDKTKGDITVVNGDGFDRETLPKLEVRVCAKHPVDETSFGCTAVIITVTDVNDEAPTLSVSPQEQEISELMGKEEIIPFIFTASDVDEDSELEFSIDWENVKAFKDYKPFTLDSGTFNINTMNGELSIGEKGIDFETVDVIDLVVLVKDKKTDERFAKHGMARASVRIEVLDGNDEKPIFLKKKYQFSVQENWNSEQMRVQYLKDQTEVLVGLVEATDKDLHSNTQYEIVDPPDSHYFSVNNEGEIKLVEQLDREMLKSDLLTIKVKAYDAENPEFSDQAEVEIQILDINDNVPVFLNASATIAIEEGNVTQDIYKVKAEDKDAAPYGTVAYFFSNPSEAQAFSIDMETGVISLTKPLDRESSLELALTITAMDNYLGNQQFGMVRTTGTMNLKVKVTDVNDNAPKFTNPTNFELTGDETDEVPEGKTILIIGIITTSDDDDPSLSNSEVCLTVTGDFKDKLKPIRLIEGSSNSWQLQVINPLEPSQQDQVEIEICDEGEPKLCGTSRKFPIQIKDINNHAPTITFPEGGSFGIREDHSTMSPLVVTDSSGQSINMVVVATDEDFGENADIHYSLEETDPKDASFFQIDETKGIISLKKNLDAEAYVSHKVKVTATDNVWTDIVEITFLVSDVDEFPPVFTKRLQNITFPENNADLAEFVTEANDEDISSTDNCYYIVKPLNGADVFHLDEHNRQLSLQNALDREKVKSYEIVVKVQLCSDASPSNEEEFNEKDSTLLKINVEVGDENDNDPQIVPASVFGGAAVEDKLDSYFMTIEAFDPDDSETSLRYEISNFKVSDPILNPALEKGDPFVIEQDGRMKLKFSIKEGMWGYISYDVSVTDSGNRAIKTAGQVYIVSSRDRVEFIFLNPVYEVESQRLEIRDIFSQYYGYRCNIDSIASVAQVRDASEKTALTAHFVDSTTNTVVSGSEIKEIPIAEPEKYIEMQDTLLLKNLRLKGLVDSALHGKKEEDNSDGLKVAIVVVSTVLGLFCVLLIASFIVTVRSYKRKLVAMSTTAFDTNSNEINKVLQPTAPNTNHYAQFGTNPVYNLDGIEIQVDDNDYLDLDGVEEQPEFEENSEGQENPSFEGDMFSSPDKERQTVNPLFQGASEEIRVADQKNTFTSTEVLF